MADTLRRGVSSAVSAINYTNTNGLQIIGGYWQIKRKIWVALYTHNISPRTSPTSSPQFHFSYNPINIYNIASSGLITGASIVGCYCQLLFLYKWNANFKQQRNGDNATLIPFAYPKSTALDGDIVVGIYYLALVMVIDSSMRSIRFMASPIISILRSFIVPTYNPIGLTYLYGRGSVCIFAAWEQWSYNIR